MNLFFKKRHGRNPHRTLFVSLVMCGFLLGGVDVAGDDGLLTEPAMNPGDIFSDEVLRQGEWFYGQPPLPSPGWLRWGATSRTTIQFDLMAWLGGVPDMNIRWSLIPRTEGGVGLAWETMVLYFDPALKNLEDLDRNDDHLLVSRGGFSGFTRLNASRPLNPIWRVFFSPGISYSRKYRVENIDRSEFHGRRFTDLWDPTVSLGLEARPSNRWTFHTSVSYGETFLYEESRPRKWQFVYGGRWIPFTASNRPFLKNMRVEFISVSYFFPDAHESRSIPVPLYLYLYWQWQ